LGWEASTNYLSKPESFPPIGWAATKFWLGAQMEKPLPNSFIISAGGFFGQVLNQK
jgi:hypothetical protein